MKVLVYLFLSLLFVSCDYSGLFDYVPGIIKPQDEVVEYTLQSGDPSIYFFDDIQKITYSGDTIVIGDVSCEIVDGEIFYMQSISVLVSRSCITFSIPNAPMLVYVS